MGVDGGVAGCACEVLALQVRDVSPVPWVLVLLGQTEVNYVTHMLIRKQEKMKKNKGEKG